ncbi:MAG: hypothetical protein EPN98_13265 [Phenylobacterium sp.]|uniref:hypothetical protein n=1 Tax=Phenylobacterium sp. TaxID=1871053 RepID=UPI0012044EBD|nr:hypothetical protein [Phenylobacterium sp.]TAL32534.1 MAG: hypothetical protein EPN98_13265 [Phenylobacterium sp.]
MTQVDAVQLALANDLLGRPDQAISILRKVLALAPTDRVRFHLAYFLLREGHDQEGWRLWEHRPARVNLPRTLSFPEWTGQSVSSLLVLPEQGFGDEIMFARYVPMLRAQGIEVTLFTKPPLVRLLSALGAPTHSATGKVHIPPHDAWVLCGSLPRLVGRCESPPYLPTSPGGSGIGFIGCGNPTQVNDGARSLPPELVADILSWPDVVSLLPEHTGAKDFEDTRQIISKLEVVLSVDTAVAHLAGAMGKPCFLMLSTPGDWRWGAGGSATRWYPSHRLFRQTVRGDWSDVIPNVKAALAGLRG